MEFRVGSFGLGALLFTWFGFSFFLGGGWGGGRGGGGGGEGGGGGGSFSVIWRVVWGCGMCQKSRVAEEPRQKKSHGLGSELCVCVFLRGFGVQDLCMCRK